MPISHIDNGEAGLSVRNKLNTVIDGVNGLVIGTDVQAFDADLSAIAALSGTDTLYYRSGASTWSAVTVGTGLNFSAGSLTTAGLLTVANNLSDLANAATARTNLGLAIGSNVQAFDADLSALAALSGTDTIYYRSGASTWSAVTVGSGLAFSTGTLAASGLLVAASNLSDLANAGTARTNLGLAIGTDVQAFDADLSALAALSGTNTLYYRSAANTWTAVTIGSGLSFSGGSLASSGLLTVANNLSDVANAGTARTNLGLAIGSDVQAFDADLSALAALSGTNTLYYRSAANTWSAVTVGTGLSFSAGTLAATGFLTVANNLSDLANAGTARTNLGLVIGTDVQAFDADLTALAALSGTNTIYYRSGSNTWSAVTVGSNLSFSAGTLAASGLLTVANNLSDLANAATARTNLGLGSAAELAADNDPTLSANSATRIATQAATKGYVDDAVSGAVNGISWKTAVRVATTTAGTLATSFENGDTVDGVVLATNDRILIKDQVAGTENGIYTINASGAPTRASDANTGSELVNATCPVSEGTVNADTYWNCTTNAPISLGSTSLAFQEINFAVGALLAANNLSDVANAGTARTNLGVAIGTNVQAFDADLSALAALSGTNTIYYRSAADTWSAVTVGTGLSFSTGTLAVTGMLTVANNLSDLNNAGTARTNLGLVIGTDVQAYDADLTALAALSGTNTIYYRSASNTWSAVTIGAGLTFSAGSLATTGLLTVANNLSDLNNAATARTNLGLVIGTDVQAYDADLSALAALSGTNTIYYRSAANTWTAVTIGTGLTFSAGSLATTGLLVAANNLSDVANATTARSNISAAGSGAITASGLTQATSRLLGRTTASSGAIEEITVGASLTFSAGALNASLASTGDINTGTDADKGITPDTLAGSNFGRRVIQVQCTDPAGSAITTGDGQGYFVVPPELNGMNLVDAQAAVVGAQSSSGLPTIQIANVTDAVDMLSTKITIDANESTSYTAATPKVIDAAHDDVATGDILRMDLDVAGTGAKGLTVILTFQLP